MTSRAFAASRVPLHIGAACAVIAVCFAIVLAFAANTANTALASWLGHRLITTHAFARSLGSETFTAAGSAVYQGWLGGLLAYATGPVAGIAPVVGVAFFFVAVLMALARAASRTASASAFVVVAALTTFAGLGALSAPSITVDWLLLSLTLFLVERATPRSVYACAIVTLVWCNIDAQGLLVPGLLLMAAAAAAISERSYSARVRLFVRAGALALVATCMTPALLELPLRAATYLGIDPSLGGLHDWQMAGVSSKAHALVVVPLIVVAALFGVWRRDRAFDAFAVIAAVVFVLINPVYAAAFAFVAAPIVVPSALRGLGGASARATTAVAVLLAFVAVCDVVLWGAAVAQRASDGETPLAAAQLASVLAADGKAHRIYCTATDACNAFVARGDARLRVFMDGREAAYPHGVIEDQLAIASVQPKWRERVRAWGVDAIVFRRRQQIGEMLALLPREWHEAGRAGALILFVKGATP